jgi:hypothetical protein
VQHPAIPPKPSRLSTALPAPHPLISHSLESAARSANSPTLAGRPDACTCRTRAHPCPTERYACAPPQTGMLPRSSASRAALRCHIRTVRTAQLYCTGFMLPSVEVGLLYAMWDDVYIPCLAFGLVQGVSRALLLQAKCNVGAAAPCARHARIQGTIIQQNACSASCCRRNMPSRSSALFKACGRPGGRFMSQI